jgi:hypothetical protein
MTQESPLEAQAADVPPTSGIFSQRGFGILSLLRRMEEIRGSWAAATHPLNEATRRISDCTQPLANALSNLRMPAFQEAQAPTPDWMRGPETLQQHWLERDVERDDPESARRAGLIRALDPFADIYAPAKVARSKRRPGRPRGHYYDDHAQVDEAAIRIAGGESRADVIRDVAQRMPGHSVPGNVRRLRRRLERRRT